MWPLSTGAPDIVICRGRYRLWLPPVKLGVSRQREVKSVLRFQIGGYGPTGRLRGRPDVNELPWQRGPWTGPYHRTTLLPPTLSRDAIEKATRLSALAPARPEVKTTRRSVSLKACPVAAGPSQLRRDCAGDWARSFCPGTPTIGRRAEPRWLCCPTSSYRQIAAGENRAGDAFNERGLFCFPHCH
jgi:hypothetical protein